MINEPHLLCVDDDDKIRELLKIYLKSKEFSVTTASDAIEATNFIDYFLFDLIVLDIMMPKKNGIEFLKYLRSVDINTPVLMLTANSQIEKKGDSFKNGCDDYLIKPFEPEELLMRIQKLLNPRLNKNKISKVSYFGDYQFDDATKTLKLNNINISLTSSELTIIAYLVKNINKEVDREEMSKILGDRNNLRSIDVTITRLRKKLTTSDNNSVLRTIRGKGYKLVGEYE